MRSESAKTRIDPEDEMRPLPSLAATRQRSAFLQRSEKRSAIASRLSWADQTFPLGAELIAF